MTAPDDRTPRTDLAAPRPRRRDLGAVLGRHRARRAARADLRVVRPPADAAAADVPGVPIDGAAPGSRSSGRGTIWSFAVPHPPLLPGYSELAPYNVIVVALEEDPLIRFVGNLLARADGEINEIDPATIEIGEPVRVVVHPGRRRRAPPLAPGLDRARQLVSARRTRRKRRLPTSPSCVPQRIDAVPATVDGGSRPE